MVFQRPERHDGGRGMGGECGWQDYFRTVTGEWRARGKLGLPGGCECGEPGNAATDQRITGLSGHGGDFRKCIAAVWMHPRWKVRGRDMQSWSRAGDVVGCQFCEPGAVDGRGFDG